VTADLSAGRDAEHRDCELIGADERLRRQ
jgi:hypothetical protein